MKAILLSIAAAIVVVAASSHAQPTVKASVSPSIAEVVRLHNSGISEDLMLAHIRNSTTPQPSADEILYLHEAGVSKSVITAMIQGGQSRKVEVTVEPTPSGPKSIGSGRLLAKPEWEQSAYAADAAAVPHSQTEVVETPAQQQSSAPTPAPVYVQQPAPVYVTPAPVVSYYAPRYYDHYDWYRPGFSIGFGFGHGWGGHGWGHRHYHHWGGHHWGRGHGIHWRGGHHWRR